MPGAVVVAFVVVVVVAVVVIGAVVIRRRSNDGVESFRRQIDALGPEARRGVVDQVNQAVDADDEPADDGADGAARDGRRWRVVRRDRPGDEATGQADTSGQAGPGQEDEPDGA